ncbi:MAG: hypothetical protein JJU21_07710 [Salinarimonas sp.]|nr:hypothetical protein [Salinarimonas sp.]
MSSSEPITNRKAPLSAGLRRNWRLAMVAGAALALAGCFTPLYAPTAGMPGGVAEELKLVDVGSVRVSGGDDAMAHELRSELIFALDGDRTEVLEKRYRLTAEVRTRQSSPIISTSTGRAASGAINARVSWQIMDIDTERVVLSGQQNGDASFDRTDQRFAALRARRDAEQRLARQLARQVATQIAIDFRTGRHQTGSAGGS